MVSRKKYWLVANPKTHTSYLSEMSNTNILNNGVNEGEARSKALSPGRLGVSDQAQAGRHHVTDTETKMILTLEEWNELFGDSDE